MPRQSEEANRMMLEQPMSKLIPRMALPTIFAQLTTWVYNLTDTFFVSSLGTNATAAVGVNYSLEQSITLGATLLAVGSGSLISRLLGQKNKEKASNILSTVVLTGILMSFVFMIIGFTQKEWVVDLLGATEECKSYSIEYMTYLLYGAPFLILSYILNQTLRSEGSPSRAMLGISVGGIINIGLDPLFIFLFNQGIAGAGMATSISKLISCVILFIPYVTRKSVVKMSYRSIRYYLKDWIQIISISASSFLRTALVMVTSTLMNHVAGGFSTAVLAAVSVGNRVMRFPFALIMGFAQGYQPVAGYNWGAKRYDRVTDSLRFSSIVAVVGGAILGLLLFLFAKFVLQLFGIGEDEDVLETGMLLIRFECITMPIHCFGMILNMLYAGLGFPGEALALSTARQGYCVIPLLFILPEIWGQTGLVACQASADVLSLLVIIPLFVRALRLLQRKRNEVGEARQK